MVLLQKILQITVDLDLPLYLVDMDHQVFLIDEELQGMHYIFLNYIRHRDLKNYNFLLRS